MSSRRSSAASLLSGSPQVTPGVRRCQLLDRPAPVTDLAAAHIHARHVHPGAVEPPATEPRLTILTDEDDADADDARPVSNLRHDRVPPLYPERWRRGPGSRRSTRR